MTNYITLLLFAISFNAYATCYTVYGTGTQPLYQSESPPIDMSRTDMGDAVKEKFPGGHMVIAASCPLTDVEAAYLQAKRNTSSPTYGMVGYSYGGGYGGGYDVVSIGMPHPLFPHIPITLHQYPDGTARLDVRDGPRHYRK
jgi:hypothetical protein